MELDKGEKERYILGMKENITRVLIETTVRNAIKEIQNDSKRSIRNLVDMALDFANGRFQNHFLKVAQEILHNEQSVYYKLVEDIVNSTDIEKLLNFGINIGYNSCTVGANIIRTIEEQQNFNIPWCLSLTIDNENDYEDNRSVINTYQTAIYEGKKLGIYTWFIHCKKVSIDILKMISKHSDCAFIIFCSAEDITETILKKAEEFHNLIFALKFSNKVEKVCQMLRKNRFPYAVHIPYKKDEIESIINGKLFSQIEMLHPIFAFFEADNSCSVLLQNKVYQYIQNARIFLKNQFIPIDLIYDNRFIDSIISNDICVAGFDGNAQLYLEYEKNETKEYNLYQNSLKDILKKAFPKTI